MKRVSSPKLKINQTYYPQQSYSRERLPIGSIREDSVDHQKYKPIMRQSSSRLQTPSVASRNNLFESALGQTRPDHKSPQVESTRSMLSPSSVLLHSAGAKQSIKPQTTAHALNSTPKGSKPNEPRAVRELVEKNALFQKKDQELSSKIKNGKAGIVLLTRPISKEVPVNKVQSPRLQSPSSSNLYKPFFPGARTPK